jgi:hypothetical protein
MADFAYALHTEACTYLLDEGGVCQWVLSPNPNTASIVQACVGAQFVASLDARVQGSLTSELVPGASALFATVSKESGRPILLRTGPILRVQFRSSEGETAMAPLPGLKLRHEAAAVAAPASEKSSAPRPRKKSEARKPPALPKSAGPATDSVTTQPKGVGKWIVPVRDSAPTTRRRIDPEESSITLVTYPGVPLAGSAARNPSAAHPKSTAEDAVPLLLKNRKKKG